MFAFSGGVNSYYFERHEQIAIMSVCDNLSKFCFICMKEKDHGIFFGDILWNLILLGVLPPGSSFTSCSEDVNIELTIWAEELRVSSVSPLLRPFPLCPLHCYVNSSEIWSPKRHNLSGYTAGTSNDFIIFFPSLC